MDGAKSFFDSFKEFVWDIIGYLLPGSFLLILLSSIVNKDYFFSSSLTAGKNNLFDFVFIVLSYLIGYAVYGFGLLKEDTLGKKSYKSKIESSIASSNEFKLCKQFYEQFLNTKGLQLPPSIGVRELRTIVMGYIPEADQKIYTFTFRSELANHIGNICISIGLMGLACKLAQTFFHFKFINDSFKYVMLYMLLIVTYVFLRQTRNRFYSISIRVPLTIYMAKDK